MILDGRNRKDIRPGLDVAIVLKKDQRSGRLTRGRVEAILTRSSHHPHGIKVRLEDGQIGRVKQILAPAEKNAPPRQDEERVLTNAKTRLKNPSHKQ